MATSLVLIRHGQSTWNAQRRWQGQANPGLTELGRQQAADASESLVDLVDSFDAAVSSPQLRAAETADILVAKSSTTQRVHEIERVYDVPEPSAGPWSGLTKEQIDEQYPGFLQGEQRPEGYELDDPLFERVRGALLELGRRYPDQTVLVVCHGGVINSVAHSLSGIEGRTPNLSGYRASVNEGNIELGERFDLLKGIHRTGGDAARV